MSSPRLAVLISTHLYAQALLPESCSGLISPSTITALRRYSCTMRSRPAPLISRWSLQALEAWTTPP